MHGKIVRYLSSNGKGAVINLSRKLFEFTKETWHDKKVIPAVDMFVEFRCNEAGQVTDCKASRYQDFGNHSMISESEFWHHETDEQLDTLLSNKRDAIVQKIYKTTDYQKIREIAVDIKPMESLKKYFSQEFSAIAFLNDLHLPKDKFLYDYTHLKRFSAKTLDNLLYSDKTIPKDDFIEELGIMTRLESAFSGLTRYQKVNVENVFKEHFLAQQCHYQALIVAINNAKDTANLCQKRINALKSDILLLQRRIQSKVDLEKNSQKLEKVQLELKKMGESENFNSNLCKRLLHLKEQFEEHYLKIYTELYQKTHERIYKKIKSGLDICITILNDKIYHKILKSVSLQKNFFKNANNDRVPTMTYFIEQYLEHLNKDKLNELDTLLYHYINKIKKKQRKYFLIVTTDEQESTNLKLKILCQNELYSVKTAYKRTLYFSLINEITFEKIYIDSAHIWENPEGLIQEAKAFKANAQTSFEIISKQVSGNRFGFLE
ncbi:hypothetical protein [Helicobacter sp. MIT 05-5294]|uniref:hypothetical protein n=1 Tax=Helicobacter sp. MIT 05-5294 TaxID=1548150 RepID=UPI0010FD2D78|nr:hypothetical protein [Helicobacter sp. MIT 05-5294]TLD86300.1 hypothetical protein LS69_006295 [Helicobacter sp. MIT 05-5294]